MPKDRLVTANADRVPNIRTKSLALRFGVPGELFRSLLNIHFTRRRCSNKLFPNGPRFRSNRKSMFLDGSRNAVKVGYISLDRVLVYHRDERIPVVQHSIFHGQISWRVSEGVLHAHGHAVRD
jgi:hypothetical protein